MFLTISRQNKNYLLFRINLNKMRKFFLIPLLAVLMACSKDDEASVLPFDNFTFSYRIGTHESNNPYYFINQIQMEGKLLSNVSSNPITPGYVPDVCDIDKELTETVFYFTCDCTVPFEDGTIDYNISLKADRSTGEMTRAVVVFPEYNVSYDFVDNMIYSNTEIENDLIIKMGTVYNPKIPNSGNPVELAINYTQVLQ